ncbi:23S rRNA (uracil(1939)-C(5))-methyltransferase RlmD [Salibacterium salarium]|uniref:23S rRNA (uracil(1939)-C(5))-methyltransferase RlmD n=1 Tax=Salibacterium salarium TaxID=284579 RepID=UPI001FE8B82A|nr:23S rRNA (uracil(1939)-C(5))-methyltransferase RlmD [Salibacterium salarium]
MVLGDQEKVLFGKGTIIDNLCGLEFEISAKSFYQINPVQTEKLYQKAIEMANLIDGEETVVDAYCGIGTIGLVASQKAGKVIGVEFNKDAVRDAIRNSKHNGVKNASAGGFMMQMAERGENVDVVFMDPPRIGSNEAFLSSLVELKPKRVVYVSCNPETQERDMKYLVNNGYEVKRIQPVDMFPHTVHCETLALIERI